MSCRNLLAGGAVALAMAAAAPASAAVITFDDLGLSSSTNLGLSPFDVGGGFTLQTSSVDQGVGALLIDPIATGNAGSAGGHTGFEFLAAKNPGQTEVITLTRADGQAFDFDSFEFHGWNNNFAPSITVSAIKGGDVVFSQTFAITNTNTQPWQFASLADAFAGVDAVTFAAPVQTVGVFALDNLTASVSAAVPEPATWAMMILGFGAVGLGLRRRGGQAFA